MKKVVISSRKYDKRIFDSLVERLGQEEMYINFKLYEKYYLIDKAHTKGLNILKFEIVNDELFIDKLPLSTFINPDLKDTTTLARLVLLANFLHVLEQEKVHKIANPRVDSTKCVGRVVDRGNNIIISKTTYDETVNKNKKYSWRVGSFDIRGHYRTLKSGKKVFIKGYSKNVSAV